MLPNIHKYMHRFTKPYLSDQFESNIISLGTINGLTSNVA